MQERGEVSLHLILTVFLGIGMALFGVLAIISYRDNTTTQNRVDQIKADAAAKAVKSQKQADDKANTIANEQPYRTYTAPSFYGGFQVQIPKDWSIYAALGTTSTGISSSSFDMFADPNFVQQNVASGATNTHQFELKLVNQPVVQVNKTFDAAIKKHTVTSKTVTVSGISASWFEGAIDTQRHNGIVVTFPNRDQTVVITTYTHDFINEFNTILGSAKFNP